MISVDAALKALFELTPVLPTETVSLRHAHGRKLAQPVFANRTQPPFDASAMDGYALKSIEADQHAQFKVIGEAAAGHRFFGQVRAGQTVRIFTGAPMPQGADAVVIHEDVTRQGDVITLVADALQIGHVRTVGGDFSKGDVFHTETPLIAADIALLAAMNIAQVPVIRRPIVALMATGDELVQPGELPADDQIIASNIWGLAAMLEKNLCDVRVLPICKDTKDSLQTGFDLARGADVIVTIGGASVGDHDLVAEVAADLGMTQSFYKIAMRPGKPLMAGAYENAVMLGLPGNPVSAMVCGVIFLLPLIRKMQGFGEMPATRNVAALKHDVGPNGPREHYMRAEAKNGMATIFERQDSALLSVLAKANALVIRPPHDPSRRAGETVELIYLNEY